MKSILCAGPVRGEPGSGKDSSRVHPPRFNLAVVQFFDNFILSSQCHKAYCKCRLWCVVLFTFFRFRVPCPVAHTYYNREPIVFFNNTSYAFCYLLMSSSVSSARTSAKELLYMSSFPVTIECRL